MFFFFKHQIPNVLEQNTKLLPAYLLEAAQERFEACIITLIPMELVRKPNNNFYRPDLLPANNSGCSYVYCQVYKVCTVYSNSKVKDFNIEAHKPHTQTPELYPIVGKKSHGDWKITREDILISYFEFLGEENSTIENTRHCSHASSWCNQVILVPKQKYFCYQS